MLLGRHVGQPVVVWNWVPVARQTGVASKPVPRPASQPVAALWSEPNLLVHGLASRSSLLLLLAPLWMDPGAQLLELQLLVWRQPGWVEAALISRLVRLHVRPPLAKFLAFLLVQEHLVGQVPDVQSLPCLEQIDLPSKPMLVLLQKHVKQIELQWTQLHSLVLQGGPGGLPGSALVFPWAWVLPVGFLLLYCRGLMPGRLESLVHGGWRSVHVLPLAWLGLVLAAAAGCSWTQLPR